MTDLPTEPGWEPDPTGRHEYRYFDGTRWTDNVSDGGAASTDPYDVPHPPPVVFSPTLPVGTRQGRSKGPLIAVIAVVVVAAAVIAFLVFGKDDNGGSAGGTSTVEVPKGGVATKSLSVGADKVVFVTVTPQGDQIDPAVGLSFDPDSQAARDLASYFSESTDDYTDEPGDLSDASGLPEPILGTINDHGPGEEESNFVVVPRAIDVTFVFADVGGQGGTLDVEIKIIDVKAPADSSDYLDALCGNEDFKSFDADKGDNICASNTSGSDFSATDSSS